MTSVTSISGGKSSAYIALNYPSDIEIFSLVCVDEPELAHKDKKIMQRVNDKLEKYIPQYGEVLGTVEDPIIFETLFELEQKTGREIIWVRGESFDELIKRKQMIPNKHFRFCTEWMKLKAIFAWLYLNHDFQFERLPRPKFSKELPYKAKNPVSMKIGYRYDEKDRVEKFTTDIELAVQQSIVGYKKLRNKMFYDWRIGDFCLIDDIVNVFTVQKYFLNSSIPFAKDSNCRDCFWKPWQQLQRNYIEDPALRRWTQNIEEKYGHTFHHKYSVKEMMKMGKQLSFEYIPGAYCQEGNCHD